MTVPLVIAMPGNEAMAQMLARSLRGDIVTSSCVHFPMVKLTCGFSPISRDGCL